MGTVVTVVVFISIAIGAAELVRAQCRRMLRTPTRTRPVRVRAVRTPVVARVSEPATLGYAATSSYATASAA